MIRCRRIIWKLRNEKHIILWFLIFAFFSSLAAPYILESAYAISFLIGMQTASVAIVATWAALGPNFGIFARFLYLSLIPSILIFCLAGLALYEPRDFPFSPAAFLVNIVIQFLFASVSCLIPLFVMRCYYRWQFRSDQSDNAEKVTIRDIFALQLLVCIAFSIASLGAFYSDQLTAEMFLPDSSNEHSVVAANVGGGEIDEKIRSYVKAEAPKERRRIILRFFIFAMFSSLQIPLLFAIFWSQKSVVLWIAIVITQSIGLLSSTSIAPLFYTSPMVTALWYVTAVSAFTFCLTASKSRGYKLIRYKTHERAKLRTEHLEAVSKPSQEDY